MSENNIGSPETPRKILKNRMAYTIVIMFVLVLGIYGVVLVLKKPKPITIVKHESSGKSAHAIVGMNDGTIVNILIINSIDYKELITRNEKLKENRDKIVKRIKTYPSDESFKKDLNTNNIESEETEENIESFKTTVGWLYDIFLKIEINTERLRQAKAHFDKGEIKLADAILKAEELENDQINLLKALELKGKDVATIKKQLGDNAKEYYIKALTTALQFDIPNRFSLSCKYYELSLRSFRNVDVLFDYAYFLQYNKQLDKAMGYYEEALAINRYNNTTNPHYLADIANTLNNLGMLQSDKNDFEQSEKSYTEALSIYRTLAQTNPQAYLANVASTLNNIGNMQSDKNDYEHAEQSYTEALAIRWTLAQTNPQAYLFLIAGTLSDMAKLQSDKNDYLQAEKYYTEALSIRRTLAETKPQVYLTHIAITLNNKIQKTLF